MGIPTKDGAWITAVKVTRMTCTRCGVIHTSKHPMNDREEDELIRQHVIKHGGRPDLTTPPTEADR